MSDPPAESPMTFEVIATCENPMEAEIFPAALREADIPHRTEWKESGALIIQVASDWTTEARAALDRASEVFFGQTRTPADRVQTDGTDSPPRADEPEAAREPVGPQPENEEEEDASDRSGLFTGDALPTPDETRIRQVWPAWLLAAIPGLGLGHMWAGKIQMFFYLAFCSLLGFLFFQFTKSLWSFTLVAFSWAIDLGFAAYQVKDQNRRAIRARKRLAKAEQDFLESI